MFYNKIFILEENINKLRLLQLAAEIADIILNEEFQKSMHLALNTNRLHGTIKLNFYCVIETGIKINVQKLMKSLTEEINTLLAELGYDFHVQEDPEETQKLNNKFTISEKQRTFTRTLVVPKTNS